MESADTSRRKNQNEAESNANAGGATLSEAPGEDAAQRVVALEARERELLDQVKEKENKYLYLYAEFENFKKRSIKERSDAMKFGWENVARDLLQVVDNLERAATHMPPSTDKNLADGLRMVISQFKSTIQKQGVEQVQTLKQIFDPNIHEAVSQEPSELPAGTILQEHMGGYTLHGRLLRPARVTVSGGKS